jgi:hypothetical protein
MDRMIVLHVAPPSIKCEAVAAPALAPNVDVFARLEQLLATMADAPSSEFDPGRPRRLLMTKDWVHPDLRAPFVHRPTIILFRDGQAQRVRGPVEPRVLGRDDEERSRYAEWRQQAAEEERKRIAASKAQLSELHQYFSKRADEKERAAEEKYEAACKRAERLVKPIPDRKEPKKAATGWMALCRDRELVANARAMRRAADRRERLACFRFERGTAAGRRTEAFRELFDKAKDGTPTKALRTALGIMSFTLFNSALPKLDRMVFGADKTKVTENYDSEHGFIRLDGLDVRDMEYIESDRMRRTLFIVDLDGWWRSVEALWLALRQYLPPEFMPNLVGYRGAEDRGGVENPHLFFMLPPTARVAYYQGCDRESYGRQKNLHSMVQKGIVSLLIPLGADPNHTNFWKFKNPLSPKWSTVACDDNFATMDEWRAFLPTITPDLREMRRRAKVIKAAREGKDPEDVALSGAVFSDGVSSRTMLIRIAQATKDPEFTKAVTQSHAAFVDWLYHPVTGAVTRRLHALHPESRAVVESVLRAQREFVVEMQMTPDRCGQYRDRGKFTETIKQQDKSGEIHIPVCGPNATAAEREVREKALKGAGARLGRQAVRDRNCGLIAEEIERRLADGMSIEEVRDEKAEVVKAIVRNGIVGRSTAYALIDEVVDVVQQSARYQASKSSLSFEPREAQADTVSDASVDNEEAGEPDLVDQDSPSEAPSFVAADFCDRSSAETLSAEHARLRRAYILRLRWKKAVEHSRRPTIADVDSLERVVELMDPDDWMTSFLNHLAAQAERSPFKRPCTLH